MADGVVRLEPCEDWSPYVVAAIPKAVTLPRATERKTGLIRSVRALAVRDGGLDLVRHVA